jgi:hypothetical protein
VRLQAGDPWLRGGCSRILKTVGQPILNNFNKFEASSYYHVDWELIIVMMESNERHAFAKPTVALPPRTTLHEAHAVYVDSVGAAMSPLICTCTAIVSRSQTAGSCEFVRAMRVEARAICCERSHSELESCDTVTIRREGSMSQSRGKFWRRDARKSKKLPNWGTVLW